MGQVGDNADKAGNRCTEDTGRPRLCSAVDSRPEGLIEAIREEDCAPRLGHPVAMSTRSNYITPEQLCIGLYVHLDMSWMDHSLPFSSFKIKNQKQIDGIRRLGLSRIRYEPERCDSQPLPLQVAPTQRDAPDTEGEAEIDAQLITEKATRIEQLRRIRMEIGAVEKKFQKAARSVGQIRRDVETRPQKALEEAGRLVGQMLATLATEGDVVIHAMSNRLGDGVYFHSLNVTVLALMLARVLKLCASDMREIGLGALFHDFGKAEIPDAILLKTEALTRPEQSILERHCEFGLAIAQRAGLAKPAQDIVMQHHEFVDGSGYPGRLRGAQITHLARLVSIVNTYDNLCNPVVPASALTPSEALAQMYARERTRLDEVQFPAFIRCLGVYPPGSVVLLSNDMPGLVLSANPAKPLRPNVLVYDPDIPGDEAVIVTLGQEPDLGISRSLRPAQLPRKVHQYLNPRMRVTYYFDKPPREESP